MTILVSAHGSRTRCVVRILRIESEVNASPDCRLVICCDGTFQQGSSCTNDDLESPTGRPFFHLHSSREYVIRTKPHRFGIPALLRSPDRNRVATLFNISDLESAIFLCVRGIPPRPAFSDWGQANENPVPPHRT